MVKWFIMVDNKISDLETKAAPPFSFKERLADLLTLSRGVIGLVILSLSFIGKDAYLTVVILALVGAATDIFDGKVARRYLKNRESKLGKYDAETDTLFVLCIIAYFSLSGIVVPRVMGLTWVGLALMAVIVSKRAPKVLLMFEIPSVLAILTITGLYDFKIFILIIVPVFFAGVIINYKRVLYLVFEYFPRVFSGG